MADGVGCAMISTKWDGTPDGLIRSGARLACRSYHLRGTQVTPDCSVETSTRPAKSFKDFSDSWCCRQRE